jgi:hypothetical protein
MLISFLACSFNPEDVGDMFLRNISWLSTAYTELYRRRQNTSLPPLRVPPHSPYCCRRCHCLVTAVYLVVARHCLVPSPWLASALLLLPSNRHNMNPVNLLVEH